MPVHVEKRGGKFRIVEQSGRIATTDKGNARVVIGKDEE